MRLLHSNQPGPVNLGNPHELPVLTIAELVRDLAESSSKIRFVPRPVDDPTVRQPDITLARSALSWEPQVSTEDGLKRTIAWFLEQAVEG